jgi:hypothetical protein
MVPQPHATRQEPTPRRLPRRTLVLWACPACTRRWWAAEDLLLRPACDRCGRWLVPRGTWDLARDGWPGGRL